MRLTTWLLSTAFLATGCNLEPEPNSSDELTPDSLQQQVTIADEVDHLDVKAVVSLRDAGGSCTGTFIHPHYILTAAHCLPSCSATQPSGCLPGTGKQVMKGEITGIDGPVAMVADDALMPTRNTKYNVDYVWFPQNGDYDGNTPPDSAVLHTTEFFKGKVIPVMPWGLLPTAGSLCDNYDDYGVDVIGYSTNEGNNDSRRRQGRFDTTCDVEMDDRAFLLEDGESNGCPGDSGGPVLWFVGGRRMVGATVSYGPEDECLDSDAQTGVAFVPRHLLERIAPFELTCGGLGWDACVAALDNQPGGSSAGAHYPINHQLEVVRVRPNGEVGLYHKAQNGPWQEPIALTGPEFSAGEGGTSTVYYPHNEQLVSFVVAKDGAVNMLSKSKNGAWKGPSNISVPGLAPAGASVAAAYYPHKQQLEAFVVGSDGRVYVLWQTATNLKSVKAITPAGWWARPGSDLSVTYNPQNDRLEVFLAAGDNRVYTIWQELDGAWTTTAISHNQYAFDSGITSVYYRPHNTVEVFAVDLQGRVNVIWKGNNGAWSEAAITEGGFARPGTAMASAFYPIGNQLEVFLVGNDGNTYDIWKTDSAGWFRHPIAAAGVMEQSGRLDAVFYPLNNQLEVFGQGQDGTLAQLFKVENSPWAVSDVGAYLARKIPISITVYEHADFKGVRQVLVPGRYNDIAGTLGIHNDMVSSVKIPVSLRVTLYEHSDFTGRSVVLTETTAALVDFNDMTSSIEIEKALPDGAIEVTPPVFGPTPIPPGGIISGPPVFGGGTFPPGGIHSTGSVFGG